MVKTRSTSAPDTSNIKGESKCKIKKDIIKLKHENNIDSLIDYYNYALFKIKKIEERIINSLFYDSYNSVLINMDYNKHKHKYNYKNIIFVVNFYILVTHYIEYIKKKLELCKQVNYNSVILTIELENLYKDYNDIKKYKNKFIIDRTLLAQPIIDDNIIVRHFMTLKYCDLEDFDEYFNYLPLEDN